MKFLNEQIQTFARATLQIQQPLPSENGITAFAVGTRRQLYLEPYQDYLLVYLNLSLEKAFHDKYLQALHLCHFRNPQLKTPWQVGLTARDALVFLIALPASTVQPDKIKEAFDQIYNISLSVSAS